MSTTIKGYVPPSQYGDHGKGYELGGGAGWCEFNECLSTADDKFATLIIHPKAHEPVTVGIDIEEVRKAFNFIKKIGERPLGDLGLNSDRLQQMVKWANHGLASLSDQAPVTVGKVWTEEEVRAIVADIKVIAAENAMKAYTNRIEQMTPPAPVAFHIDNYMWKKHGLTL